MRRVNSSSTVSFHWLRSGCGLVDVNGLVDEVVKEVGLLAVTVRIFLASRTLPGRL